MKHLLIEISMRVSQQSEFLIFTTQSVLRYSFGDLELQLENFLLTSLLELQVWLEKNLKSLKDKKEFLKRYLTGVNQLLKNMPLSLSFDVHQYQTHFLI